MMIAFIITLGEVMQKSHHLRNIALHDKRAGATRPADE